jgi:hypothetical protein
MRVNSRREDRQRQRQQLQDLRTARRRIAVSESTRFHAIDWLMAVVVLTDVAVCARAPACYAICAFIPPTLLVLFLAISKTYRQRWRGRLRGLRADVRGYATGRGGIPWAAALVLVAVPTALLDLSNGVTAGSTDTFPVIPTAISVVTEHDWQLDEFCHVGSYLTPKGADHLPYFLQRTKAGIVSNYPAGIVPFALPIVALSRVVGAELGDSKVHFRLEKLGAVTVAGLSSGLFFLIALRLARPSAAAATTALLAVASGMFSTVGQGLWQHDGVIFWSLVALFVEFHHAGAERPTWGAGTWIQGVACGLMPTCRLTAISFLVPFGLWLLLRVPRRALAIGVVAILVYLPWGLLYEGLYGNFFGPSLRFMDASRWNDELAAPLAGVLFSPSHGLLVYQPWSLLAALGLIPAVRRRAASLAPGLGPPGWVRFCLAAIALHVVLIAAWGCWWGAYCWGSRLVVEVVPLCALLCLGPITALSTCARGRSLVLGLALLGVLMHVPGVYGKARGWYFAADPHTYKERLWSWSAPPFLYPMIKPSPPTGP